MARDVQIGRVTVKVMPDLDGFARETLAKMKAIESGLKPIEIEATLDTKRLEAEARAATRRISRDAAAIKLRIDETSQSSLHSALRRIDAELERLREVEIEVDLNESDLRAAREMIQEQLRFEFTVDKNSLTSLEKAIQKIDNEIARRREVVVEVGLDDASLQRARADLQRALNSERAASIQLELDIEAAVQDAERAARQMARQMVERIEADIAEIEFSPELDPMAARKIKRDLAEAMQREGELRQELELELDPASRARTMRALEAVQDKVTALRDAASTVDIDLEVKQRDLSSLKAASKAVGGLMAQLSGAAFIENFTRPLRRTLQEISTRAVPVFGALTLALNGVAGAVLAGGANLAVLAADLARIGPAVLPLPGIFAGMAVGIGASIAVLKDFNDVIPGVGDRLSEIQDRMSAEFWSGAEKPIRNMIDTLLPQFGDKLVEVSGALAVFYGNLATSLTNSLSGEPLERMFDNLSESIEIAAEHTDSYAEIIRVLGEVGSHYLPKLAAWFGDIADRFAAWLDEAEKSGDIYDWIDRAVDNLGDLGRVLMATIGIFGNFAQAARDAGSSTLNDLANGLERIESITGSAGFQDGMTTVFAAAHDMMGEIARVAGPSVQRAFEAIAETADELFPSIGRSIGFLLKTILDTLTSPEFQEGFTNFVAGLEAGLQSLSTASGDIGGALGGVKTVMGAIALGAGPLLAAAFAAINEVVGPLAEVVAGLFLFGFQSLQGTIETITPLLGPIAESFATLLTHIQPLAEEFLPLFRGALTNILEVAPGFIEMISSIVESLGKIASVIMPVVIPAILWLQEIFLGIFSAIMAGAELFFSGLSQVFEGFSLLFSGSWSGFWEGIRLIASGVWDMIVGGITVWFNVTLLGLFRKGTLALLGKWTGGWNAIKAAGTAVKDKIVAAAKAMWDKIKSFFDSGGPSIGSTWKGAWDEIGNTLNSAKDAVLRTIKGLWDDAVQAFQSGKQRVSASVDELKAALSRKFREAMNLIKEAIDSGIDRMQTTFSNLPGNIKSWLGSLGSTLWSAGQSLIQGLINGITSKLGSLRSKLSEVTSLIPAWKGPPKKDASLLTGAGELIMQSLIDGFESKFGDVRKSLTSLTDEIGGIQVDGPQVGAASVTSSARRAVLAGIDDARAGGGNHRTINYYAAPGTSLDAEEDLFEALDRGRNW